MKLHGKEVIEVTPYLNGSVMFKLEGEETTVVAADMIDEKTANGDLVEFVPPIVEEHIEISDHDCQEKAKELAALKAEKAAVEETKPEEEATAEDAKVLGVGEEKSKKKVKKDE